MQDSEIDKQDDLDTETLPESAETIPDDPVPDESKPDDPIPDEQAPDNIESDDPAPDEIEITTANVLEAILFAADEPVAPARLADIIGTCGVKQIRQHIDELNEKYRQTGCVFRIEAIAGGYLMLTQPRFNPWLRQLIKVRSETKLSPAALETLAIIAYKQPVMRVDVEAIRGVGAGEMTRQLIEKGLVKIAGRAEELGRPLLYGTTRKFLEIFGLDSLKDLPNADTPKDNNS